MLKLSTDYQQFSDLTGYLERIKQRFQDLRPIERELGEIQREELRLRFLSSPATEIGGIVYGEVYWNRLSDWYLNQVPRRRKGQIMIDTQKLKIDATTEGAGNTSRVEDDGSYSFTINTDYAAKQDEMRKLLFWSEGLLQKTEDIILNYLIEETRNEDGK